MARKKSYKERPYDYKKGQWYHPEAKLTKDYTNPYFDEYYCPICKLTFEVSD